MTENRVGIRELKNKLSDYLRRVKAGETIIVTEYGRTIGQLIPVKPSIEEKILSMVDAGQADWNGKKLPPHQPLVTNKGDRLLSDLVIENRQ